VHSNHSTKATHHTSKGGVVEKKTRKNSTEIDYRILQAIEPLGSAFWGERSKEVSITIGSFHHQKNPKSFNN
jgi:hypothetical protein